MSILIRVEKALPIEVGLLLPEIGTVLAGILGLLFAPTLQAVDRFDENAVFDEIYCIEPGRDDLVGIRCVEESAIVSVSTSSEREDVYISPDGWRTALGYALAPAVAIALAAYSESEITDSALAYSKTFSTTPSQLMAHLKSEKTYWDLKLAGKEFLKRQGWE